MRKRVIPVVMVIFLVAFTVYGQGQGGLVEGQTFTLPEFIAHNFSAETFCSFKSIKSMATEDQFWFTCLYPEQIDGNTYTLTTISQLYELDNSEVQECISRFGRATCITNLIRPRVTAGLADIEFNILEEFQRQQASATPQRFTRGELGI